MLIRSEDRRTVAELVRLYEREERELRRIMASATATKFERGQATLLVRQIDASLANLRDGQLTWLENRLPVSYREGMRRAQVSAKASLTAMTQLDRMTVATLAGRIANSTTPAIDSVSGLLGGVLRNCQQAVTNQADIWQDIVTGQIRGLGPEEMARRIELTLMDGATRRLTDWLPPQVRRDMRDTAHGRFISITCKDGKVRRYNMRKYSQLVAQTASRDAATEGTLRTTQALGMDLVRMSVHTGACPLCIPVQGKIFSISGRNPNFPALSGNATPLHPRCGHSMNPVSEVGLQQSGEHDRMAEFSRDPERAVDNGPEYSKFRLGEGPAGRTDDYMAAWSERTGSNIPRLAEERLAVYPTAPG